MYLMGVSATVMTSSNGQHNPWTDFVFPFPRHSFEQQQLRTSAEKSEEFDKHIAELIGDTNVNNDLFRNGE